MEWLIEALRNAPPGFIVSIARLPGGVKVLAVGPAHPQQDQVMHQLGLLQKDLDEALK